GIGGFGAQCNGPYPTSADVSIAYVDKPHHDALRARIDNSSYNDGTPTGSAIGATGANGTGGYGELASYTPSAPLPPGGKKVLILITDGCPSPGDACQT